MSGIQQFFWVPSTGAAPPPPPPTLPARCTIVNFESAHPFITWSGGTLQDVFTTSFPDYGMQSYWYQKGAGTTVTLTVGTPSTNSYDRVRLLKRGGITLRLNGHLGTVTNTVWPDTTSGAWDQVPWTSLSGLPGEYITSIQVLLGGGASFFVIDDVELSTGPIPNYLKIDFEDGIVGDVPSTSTTPGVTLTTGPSIDNILVDDTIWYPPPADIGSTYPPPAGVAGGFRYKTLIWCGVRDSLAVNVTNPNTSKFRKFRFKWIGGLFARAYDQNNNQLISIQLDQALFLDWFQYDCTIVGNSTGVYIAKLEFTGNSSAGGIFCLEDIELESMD